MKPSSTTTAVRDELQRLGINSEVIQGKGSPHIKVRFKVGDRTRTIICARSSSDYRAPQNARALVRRLLRGVQPNSK